MQGITFDLQLGAKAGILTGCVEDRSQHQKPCAAVVTAGPAWLRAISYGGLILLPCTPVPSSIWFQCECTSATAWQRGKTTANDTGRQNSWRQCNPPA